MNVVLKSLLAAALVSASVLATADNAPLTRAEVLADLVIYRESGLLELDRDSSVNTSDAQYRAALQRYEALRHSERFAQLVRSYSTGG